MDDLTSHVTLQKSIDTVASDVPASEAADYIAAIAEPLRRLADRSDLPVVAYLLGMAVEEARGNIVPKPTQAIS